MTCLTPLHGIIGLKLRMFLEPLSAFLIALIIHITKIAYLIRYNKQYSTFLQADGLQYNDTLLADTPIDDSMLE